MWGNTLSVKVSDWEGVWKSCCSTEEAIVAFVRAVGVKMVCCLE